MRWNLDVFFQGGSHSTGLANELKEIRLEEEALTSLFEKGDSLRECILRLQALDIRLREVSSFIWCLLSQDVADKKATQLKGALSELQALYETLQTRLDGKLQLLDEGAFSRLLQESSMQPIAFFLRERRSLAQEKLPLIQENLISALSVDGYHGWGEFYPYLISSIQIPFEGQELSAGQIENKFCHPQRKVRREAFQKWEEAFAAKETLFSQVINHLGGFRWKVYQQRKWDHYLKEALLYNRMQKQTLDAMWSVVAKNKGEFIAFLEKKAALLKIGKLAWYDLDAPLGKAEESEIPYEKAQAIILEHFEKFHPRLAQFARRNFTENWIEAEDRPGKRPGGFCTFFPKAKQSRIFMTYSGSILNLATLAHELGHAYHSAMVEDLPGFAQDYRMNIAESASTFAELLISDAMLQQMEHKEGKIALLNDKIQRSVAFLMNIHARFLFESRFYAQREQGGLSAEELNSLMLEAQREAYCDTLAEWHPHFWAAKMHFYFTDVPFYNFPYTFGYLFSLGLYARACKEGKDFAQKYDALFRDTGRMGVEELAQKHLGVDLTQETFWQEALDVAKRDISEFFTLIK